MRKWVDGGSGADGLYEQSDNWNAEDKYLRELKTRLEDKLKSVGAFMQSESGEAMKDQAMPVVLWTEITADSAKLQSQQMTAQGEAFKKVQTSIPAKSEEEAIPDDGWLEENWDSFWTGSTDAEDAKAHNEKLRQEAVQAFTTYQDTTQSNVSSSAVFEAPPTVAQPDGGVSSSSGPSVGGVDSSYSSPSTTSSAWAGGSGGGSLAGAGSGAGGAGGSYGGGSAGTGAAWANLPGGGSGSGQTPGGGSGAGRVPGGPGTPGYPGGTPGLGAGRPGAGTGAGGRGGAGSAGGRGGAGAGRGLGAGSGAGAGGRGAGSGMGAGGRSGMGGLGGASGSGVGGAGGAGGRGGVGAGAGAGARGRGQEGEDDLEHETPDYLVGDQGVFDEDLPKVAPPVFGDWDNQR
ncbi:PPE domain-containing protein [Saccharopolyspora flava]|nr:PPE domain-containing protein [Saccharopolyspora flava]